MPVERQCPDEDARYFIALAPGRLQVPQQSRLCGPLAIAVQRVRELP
jgi:hypothetical protein